MSAPVRHPLEVLSKMVATEIPRVGVDDLTAMKLVKAEQPVVITDTYLADSAVDKWTLEYLRDNWGSMPVSVRETASGHFKFADMTSNAGNWDFTYDVAVRDEKMDAFYAEFVRRIRAAGREPFQVRGWRLGGSSI